jgi:hypothetical protein
MPLERQLWAELLIGGDVDSYFLSIVTELWPDTPWFVIGDIAGGWQIISVKLRFDATVDGDVLSVRMNGVSVACRAQIGDHEQVVGAFRQDKPNGRFWNRGR